MSSVTIKEVKTFSVLSQIKHSQISSLFNNLLLPQTFNIVFHFSLLRQTFFQGPQLEASTLNGLNAVLLDIKQGSIQKKQTKQAKTVKLNEKHMTEFDKWTLGSVQQLS